MKDARGEVVYVGKAQSLRHRVRSYWQKNVTQPLEGHRASTFGWGDYVLSIPAQHPPKLRKR